MPARSDADAKELESPVILDESRPEVGFDLAHVEESVPFDDWILLRMEPPMRSSRGGIVAAAQSVPESRVGVVVSQGEGLPLPVTNGRTRMPMNTRRGDRVLIERRAGKTMPGVPDETVGKQVGYLLIRNGGTIARLKRRATTRGGAPALEADDVEPFEDWTLIKTDRPRSSTAPRAARGVLRPRFKLPAHLALPQSAQTRQSDRSDTWTGTIVAQGPGRHADNGEPVKPRASLGDRVLFTRADFQQTVPGLDGYLLVLEREQVVALSPR